MKVIRAKTAGFCFGVKRAVNTVYEEVEKGVGPIYTYGPIIHNEEVVHDLEKKGVSVLNSPEELETVTKGTVIIRSHGVSRDIYEIIEKNGLHLVDATCPFVLKIHNHRPKRERSRKKYHHHRKRQPSGSGRNQRLVLHRSFCAGIRKRS